MSIISGYGYAFLSFCRDCFYTAAIAQLSELRRCSVGGKSTEAGAFMTTRATANVERIVACECTPPVVALKTIVAGACAVLEYGDIRDLL